jgi:hypothetical protein
MPLNALAHLFIASLRRSHEKHWFTQPGGKLLSKVAFTTTSAADYQNKPLTQFTPPDKIFFLG